MPRRASAGGRIRDSRSSRAPITSPSMTSAAQADVTEGSSVVYPSISVVLPAYNEEAVIAETVARTDRALTDLGVADFEILVIDDGSSDATAARASRSEERRVGEECRSRWAADPYTKK